jgi:hypothetical protein
MTGNNRKWVSGCMRLHTTTTATATTRLGGEECICMNSCCLHIYPIKVVDFAYCRQIYFPVKF